MAKCDFTANRGEYSPVADQITLFYSRFPAGRIITELVSRTEAEITFRALVYRSVSEPNPAAVGWAAERIGDGDINSVACLENTETSAIGRALANLGLTASPNRPSREEMGKADRLRASRHAEPVRASPTVRAAPPLSVVARTDAGDLTNAVSRRESEWARLLDRLREAFDLLTQAERAGFSAGRTRVVRFALTDPLVTVGTVERVERLLRAWLRDRATRLPRGDDPPAAGV